MSYMSKRILYIIGCVSIIAFLLIGCGKKESSTKTDKSHSAEQTLKKTSSSSKTSSSTSSSNDSQVDQTKLDDKTIGVLAMLYNRPDYLKRYINAKEYNGIYYGTREWDAKDSLNGYSFMTGEGDPTSYLYYKNENGIIKLQEWIPRDSVADGYFKSSSISLKQLIIDYYSDQYKQNEVNGYVNKVKLDSDFEK